MLSSANQSENTTVSTNPHIHSACNLLSSRKYRNTFSITSNHKSNPKSQGTRMEERLDDALNVLRNHCEPQIAGLAASLADAAGYVLNSPGGSLPPHDNQSELGAGGSMSGAGGGTTGGVSIKLERGASSSSECFLICPSGTERTGQIMWNVVWCLYFCVRFAEKRKDPPDADANKPSSSSMDGSQKGGKRTRR